MRLKQVAFGFLAIVFAASLSFAADMTHMGVLPAEHVTLKAVRSKGFLGCFNNPDPVVCGAFFRTFPDGTTDSNPFHIPERKILVVTDVDWHYQALLTSSENLAGTQAIFRLLRHKTGDPINNQVLVSVAKIEPTCPSGVLSQCVDASGNIQMTSGFVVFSEGSLGFETNDLPLITCADTSCLQEAHIEVFVRGYLLPDRRRPQ